MTTTTNGERVTGTRNEQYDLISILYHALEGAATYDTYIQDAEKCGDNELCQFFQEIKDQNSRIADRAKDLLARRLSQPAMQ